MFAVVIAAILLSFMAAVPTLYVAEQASMGRDEAELRATEVARDLIAYHQAAVTWARANPGTTGVVPVAGLALPAEVSATGLTSDVTAAGITTWVDPLPTGVTATMVARKVSQKIGVSYFTGLKAGGTYHYFSHQVGDDGVLTLPLPPTVPDGRPLRYTPL